MAEKDAKQSVTFVIDPSKFVGTDHCTINKILCLLECVGISLRAGLYIAFMQKVDVYGDTAQKKRFAAMNLTKKRKAAKKRKRSGRGV